MAMTRSRDQASRNSSSQRSKDNLNPINAVDKNPYDKIQGRNYNDVHVLEICDETARSAGK